MQVGRCFLLHAEAMKTAYTQYCLNHDRAEQLLEKFEATPELQKVLFLLLLLLLLVLLF